MLTWKDSSLVGISNDGPITGAKWNLSLYTTYLSIYSSPKLLSLSVVKVLTYDSSSNYFSGHFYNSKFVPFENLDCLKFELL